MADDTRGRFRERIRSLIASGSEGRHAAPVIHIGKFGEAQGLGGAIFVLALESAPSVAPLQHEPDSRSMRPKRNPLRLESWLT